MYANTLNDTTNHVITSYGAMCKTTPCTIPPPIPYHMPIAKWDRLWIYANTNPNPTSEGTCFTSLCNCALSLLKKKEKAACR
jgi:hypothetical protein